MKLLLLALLVILAGCAAPGDPYTRAPDGSQTQSGSIPTQQFLHPTFGAKVPLHARISFQASAPIDAWIANETECVKYGTRSFAPAASALNATQGTLDADFAAGLADCLILDNTDFAGGRAPAGAPINVTYTMNVWFRKG